MLGQPINNSQTIIEEQNTMQNEATNLVSAPAPNELVQVLQAPETPNPFEIKTIDEFEPSEGYHVCMIRSSSLLISEESNGEPSTPLKNLIIIPRKIVEYDRVNYGKGVDNADKDKARAFKGFVDVEGEKVAKDDYLKKIRETYPTAYWERRGCVYGHLVEAVLLDGKTHAKLQFPEFVQVYFSPTSLQAWKSIKTLTGYNCKMGIPVGNCIKLSPQVAKNSKGASWTKFTFEPVYVGPAQLGLSQYVKQPQILDNAA